MPGLRVYKAQPTPAPSPSPRDYGLVEMPGAPAHLEAMLLGWRFSHAVIYVGDGHLVEAWFDRVRERDVAAYPVRDISWFGVRTTRGPTVSIPAAKAHYRHTPSAGIDRRRWRRMLT